MVLASLPALTYPILLELNTPESLADLLSHENTDVAIAVIEVLEEWLDPESLEDVDEDDEEDENAGEKKLEATKTLVEGLIGFGVVELIVSGLDRFNEEDESERGGVFHSLSAFRKLSLSRSLSLTLLTPPRADLIENLITLTPSVATTLLAPKSSFLKFLLVRLAADKLPSDRDQNRFYAAEMLSLVLSLAVDGVAEARKRIADEEYVDNLLKVLSVRSPPSALASS